MKLSLGYAVLSSFSFESVVPAASGSGICCCSFCCFVVKPKFVYLTHKHTKPSE